MEHSKDFPPSGAKYWRGCPAWLSSDHSNYASTFGVLCHDVAEEWIKKEAKPFAVPPEIEGLVGDYVDYCLSCKAFADRYLIEEQLRIDVTGSFGTCDFASYSEGELEVVDLKTGMSSVSPNCDQLKLYALGAVNRFQLRGVENYTVALRIFQRGRDKTHVITNKELYEFEKEVKKDVDTRRIALVDVEGYTKRGNACFWCARKSTCPEWVMDINEFEEF